MRTALSDDNLCDVFHALGDRTRLEIVRLVSRDDHTVLELASRFEMSQPAVSKHLGVLERAGLIARIKDGRYRRCRAIREPISEATKWLDQIEQYWNSRLDRLEELINDADGT